MSTAKKKLTTCPPKTAVVYARYSSHGQRDVSIEQQLRDIRAFAEREGYTIIHEYADRAKSGFKNSDRRAEFQAMLMAAASGAFDTVIAWKVDRFGRDRRESSMYKGQLADVGVSVVYAMEPIPDGAAGCLTEGMLEAIAEWYSRNLGENVRRGQHDNALKCLSNGHIPLGYTTSADHHLIIKEDEAATVREIFELYSEGYSLSAIEKKFESEGIRTKKGCVFRKMSLLGILENEAYIGVYRFGDIRIPGGMPAIIDQDLFDLCQEQRKKTARHARACNQTYLLSGKTFCGFCGTKMYGASANSSKRRFNYYVCNKKKAGRFCPDSRSIHKEALEGSVIDITFNRILQGERLDQLISMSVDILNRKKESSTVSQLEKERRDILRRIDNITLAISEGIWTKQTASLLDELNKRADNLQKEISYCHMTGKQHDHEMRLRFMKEKLANGDMTDPYCLQTLVNTFINSITVYNDYARIVLNLEENIDTIPIDELPPLSKLPDWSNFAFGNVGQGQLYTLETHPVIAFKIAI